MEKKQIKDIISATTRPIVLYGPVGTGKTSVANEVVKELGGGYSITLHRDMLAQELLGHFIPKGNDFIFLQGLVTRAWMEGKPLVVNEVDKASDSCFDVLHALFDDPMIAELTLPTGEVIRPKEGYKVIATMNGDPRDLPDEAVKDRLSIRILMDMPPDNRTLQLPKEIFEVLKNSYKNISDVKITTREAIAYADLMTKIDKEVAANIVFREKGNDVIKAIQLAKE